ncbi:type I polyketide synthase [Streptomonospora salina]|uniref:Acyl transferase domain-containing protein n=1 Tax=Streptomonospora salina TaxID=104205 RepID=A0A841ENL4_9ACTN|nr:type I polyketide synthase [Streptomonospora salina]MBB6001011.1 acyl transferase domain-containing protein [Streptomonospora salina]
MSAPEPIALVGMDVRFPGAEGKDAFFDLLMSSGDGIGPVPPDRWPAEEFTRERGDAARMNTSEGGFLADISSFDNAFFGVSPAEAAQLDPQQRRLLQSTWCALEDSGRDPGAMAGSRTGVYVGVMGNEWAQLHLTDYPNITAQAASGNGYYMTANRLSYQFDFTGPSQAVDTACSSSLVALHTACGALRLGECDTAVAAGVNIILVPTSHLFYAQAGLSAPDGRCKPFSADADGIGRSEGVAVLVLRRLSDALAEDAPIYAVVRGSAVNHDGRSNGLTAPNRWAQERVLAETYRRAGVDPHEVGFIEGHGTGTLLGDMIEVRALGAHYGGRTSPCAFGSVKGNVGHCEGAAGLAGVAKAALALRRRVVPPSRYAESQNPELNLEAAGLRLLRAPQRLAGDTVAAVSSFGLGGTNAHALLQSAPATRRRGSRPAPGADRAVGVFTVSADSAEGLRRNLGEMADWVQRSGERPARLAWTSNRVKAGLRHRFAAAAPDRHRLSASLRAAANGERPTGRRSARGPRVGMLFSGQGAQYPGMAHRLYETCPPYREALDEADAHLHPHLGRSVRAALADGGDDVHHTTLTQPALFAVEYAMAAALVRTGMRPAWLIGHSIGEYAAACVAEALSLPDACRLVAARARLIGSLPGGAMLNVSAGPDVLDGIAENDAHVDVAAVNTPRSGVLSGDPEALRGHAADLAAAGIGHRWLEVSHAFHSAHTDPVLEEFGRIADEVVPARPSIPIYSTLLGRRLDEDKLDGAYWRDQIRSTVRFADAAEAALETDPTHLVEAGPRPVLTGLFRRIRPGLEAAPLSPCPGPGSDGTEFAEVVAALYTDGAAVAPEELAPPRERRTVRLLPYAFATDRRFPVADDYRPAFDGPVQSTATAPRRTGPGPAEPSPPATPSVPETGAHAGPAPRDAEIAELMADAGGYAADGIDPDALLFEDLGFDSIVLARVLGEVERRWPHLSPLPVEDILANAASLRTLSEYMQGRLDGPRTGAGD